MDGSLLNGLFECILHESVNESIETLKPKSSRQLRKEVAEASEDSWKD